MRGAPQVWFSLTIRKISSRISLLTHLLPTRVRCRVSKADEEEALFRAADRWSLEAGQSHQGFPWSRLICGAGGRSESNENILPTASACSFSSAASDATFINR